MQFVPDNSIVLSKETLIKDVLAIAALIFAVAVVAQLPELRRYMKIRRM